MMRELAQLLNINNKNFKVFRIHGWKYSYSNNKTSYESYWDKILDLHMWRLVHGLKLNMHG